jgi:ubiquinone/menaquinone biosynthesis C-methylase UbiE
MKDELDRIRHEYARRLQDSRYSRLYSCYNPANLFMLQEREREMLALFARHLGNEVGDLRVLDLGTGDGHQLARLIGYGFSAKNMVGLDLLAYRVENARVKYSNVDFVCGEGGRLPFPSATFDLIFQFTVFTSVLDDRLRQGMAGEMLRVLRPRGWILWYDYWLNPNNPQTRGIGKKEICALFQGCSFDFRSVTLAPPLARFWAPKSWAFCSLLNQVPFLKTHYLALIQKNI